MQQLTQITDTLFGLILPIDAINIERGGMHLFYDDNRNGRRVCIKNTFGFRFEIIGTVSTTEIDFGKITIEELSKSIEYMVHSGITAFDEMKYYDYCITDFILDNAEDSFRSLLSSKGITPTNETKVLILKRI